MENIFLASIEKNKNKIYRICTAYSTTREDARDLFQEVILNIWRSMASFQNKSSLDTWIYRITLNVCLKAQQKNKRIKDTTIAADMARFENLQIHTEDKKAYPELYDCIRRLSETERPVIMLYLEDLPYRNISEITGLSENNVAVKISRIKTKLFDCLNNKL